jgi:L-ascorbate metabolism protein UlaG (beta-lactamase superfamily)
MLLRGILLAMLFTGPLLVSCTGAPTYRGATSDHFNGSTFVNTRPMAKGAGDLIRLGWGTLSEAETWPDWIEVSQRADFSSRNSSGIAVTFINHASFLIQADGLNILTDPIYSDRASPFQWAGPKRVHRPGVAMDDLPEIDVILVSHNHYDHLDVDTLKQLQARQDSPPLLLSGLGNGAYFERLGLKRHEDLDWEDRFEHDGVEFVFTECRHRSGRGAGDQMKTLWGSFVIKTSAGNVYFAGDSGYDDHFRATGDAHGPFELALLPIGAYEPRWFMADVHVNPLEAVQAHLDLGTRLSLGMHFGTFQLTYEAIDQPERDLAAALEKLRVNPQAFQVISPGETRLLAGRQTTRQQLQAAR